MPLHWPTFLTRTGSALVFGAVMLAGLLGPVWAFALLVMLIQVLCLHEYIKLMAIIRNEQFPVGNAVLAQSFGFILWVGAALFFNIDKVQAQETLPEAFEIFKHYGPAILFILPALILLVTGLTPKRMLQGGLDAMGGLFYIVLPCVLLFLLKNAGGVYPIALIVMIWTNDTIAYIVGSFIGKTPFSAISPKKTWEGTAGGAILTLAGAVVWSLLSEQIPLMDAVAFALCAAVAGTAGDLLESRIKRTAGVKDSGRIMPGHGGALDRFDSLLVAIPFASAYLYIVQNIR